VLIGNQTQGGAGSTGPNGGKGLGGGLSAGNGGTVTLQNVPIMASWADGAPGDGRGGPAGQGLGGGVYVASAAMVTPESLPVKQLNRTNDVPTTTNTSNEPINDHSGEEKRRSKDDRGASGWPVREVSAHVGTTSQVSPNKINAMTRST
jgi:hypothetical protein